MVKLYSFMATIFLLMALMSSFAKTNTAFVLCLVCGVFFGIYALIAWFGEKVFRQLFK